MSTYSTGELAKLGGVSVRTVQYYDQRGILVPTGLTEGGRRLYNQEDLKRLQTICFLRDLDFSIDDIKTVLEEENSREVLSLLLDTQIQSLQAEIDKKREKRDSAIQLSKELLLWRDFSPETMWCMTTVMENKKTFHNFYRWIIPLGLIGNVLFWGGIWLSFQWRQPLPFLLGMGLSIIYVQFLIKQVFCHLSYICPECHEIFKPELKEVLFASHTLHTRKVTCSKCHHKSHCIEVLNPKEEGHVS